MQNKNKIIIYFLVGVICAMGFILYSRLTRDESKPETKVEEKKEIKQVTQVLQTNVGTFIIDKDGSVYYRITVDKYVGAKVELNDSSIGTYGNYEVSDYVTGLDSDRDTNEVIEDHKFDGYKLNLENINSAYEIQIGNGGSSEVIYFLSKDGKVNELKFDSDGKELSIKLSKDTSTYSNIVSVLQSSGFGAFEIILVDKDGNKYIVTNK